MLAADVSGIVANINRKTGPAIHSICQSDHLQPLAMTAKPDSSGPSAGAQKAAGKSVSKVRNIKEEVSRTGDPSCECVRQLKQ